MATIDPQTQYERALMRAQRAGVRVVGRGTVRRTGERFYAVRSATEADRWHIVVQRNGLVCDCTAAQYGRYCMHVAVVRAELERAREIGRKAVASGPEPAPLYPSNPGAAI